MWGSVSGCLCAGRGVSQGGAACVCVWAPPCQTAAGARRQPQGLEQSGPEGLTQEEVDERVQNRVQGWEEKCALLQLKKEELQFTVKDLPGLAYCVRHTGKVKRHKAHKEHSQDEEHICIHFSFSLLRCADSCPAWRSTYCPSSAVGLGARIGFVQLFGDKSVACYHCRQVSPENDLTDVIDHLVPKKPSLRLEVAALEVLRGRRFRRQDHVGQAEEQQESPDGPWEELPTGQSSCVGPSKGLERLPTAVDADEAKEEDADIHGEVEEHRGNSTDKYTQASGCHVGVCQHLEKKNRISLSNTQFSFKTRFICKLAVIMFNISHWSNNSHKNQWLPNHLIILQQHLGCQVGKRKSNRTLFINSFCLAYQYLTTDDFLIIIDV